MRLIDADELKKWFKARMALWPGTDEVLDVISDAPTISVEQDAVEPIRSKDADVWYCGNCDAIVGEETLTIGGIQEVRHNYCPECGRKVKWDENINLP